MPKISLALPVYNGERFLEDCLDSILNQTFREFELVVSDNASTDSTPDILARYAAKDDRIRIITQAANVGAAENFNLLVDETTAEIFKWCAHDDRLEPEFLAKTYAALEAEPNAVLAHCHTVIHHIDQDTSEVFVPAFTMPRDNRVTRLNEMLRHGQLCYEVFGLIRRASLQQTDLIGNFRGGDNVLLFRLALLGAIVIVPEPLFILGRHETQSTILVKDSQAYHAWFTGRSEKFSFPDWVFLRETWGVMRGVKMPIADRAGCYRILLGETYRRRRGLLQSLRVTIETVVFGSSDPQRRRRLGRRAD